MRLIEHNRGLAGVDPGLLDHIPGLMVKTAACFGSRDALQVAALRHRDADAYESVFRQLAPVVDVVSAEGLKYPHLRGYQNSGIEWLTYKLKFEQAALLADDMGCIEGAAEVVTHRNGNTRRMRLDDFYVKFKKLGGLWKVRSLTGEIFRQAEVEDVVLVGQKNCLAVSLENGKRVVCTPDHEILTTIGWVRADALTVSHTVMTNGYNKGVANSNWRGGRNYDKDGYVLVHCPEHPNAVQGTVREHRLLMESSLGRFLEPFEIVHHKNGIKDDNSIDNLEVLTKSSHAKEHASAKWKHLDGGRTRNGGEVVILPRLSRVQKITEVGERLVYDIKMKGPYKNFVADGVVVHNCGKSVQTLMTWVELGKPYPLLIVCPGSVRRTWRAQFKRWLPDTEPVLVEASKDFAKVQRDSKAVITSYELAQKLPNHFTPHMLVMDECHRLRGRVAKQNRAFQDIAKCASYRLGLTGTPLWNRPRDLWAILKVLFNYRFGTAEDFDYAYCGASINPWGGRENKGATRTEELALRLKHVILRRTKQDVKSELPTLDISVEWVDGTREAAQFQKRAALRQCTFGEALKATLSAKIKPTIELALRVPNAFICCWRKEDVYAIAEALTEEGKSAVTITGDDSPAVRERAIADAAKNKSYVVATIDSTGTGVDGLQHVTSYGIFHALDFVPLKMMQAISRLHRGGQELPVTWTCLAMRNSADEYVVSTVIEKMIQQQAVMGAGDDSLTSALTGTNEDDALAAIYASMEEEE